MSLLDLRGFWANPADALAASSTGVGNVTAALSVTHNLATTTTGVGVASSALSVKHNLAVVPVGVAATSAALSGGSAVAPPDGTGADWYRRRPLELRAQPVLVRLGALAIGVGRLKGSLTVWSPTYSPEEINALAALVDEEELAVLLAI